MNEQSPPEPSPEGAAVAAARVASGRSRRNLADAAGISDTRWRQIEQGWQRSPSTNGVIEARASAPVLARMARVLGFTAARLRELGRPDAADILDDDPRPVLPPAGVVYLVVQEGGGLAGAYLDADRAARIAEATGAVIAAAPVIADYRPH